jgi:histidinol-phosphate aminotransferase
MGLKPSGDLFASGFGSFEAWRTAMQSNEYDSMAKLANNENPWGPPKIALDAMNEVWKYSGRYGYPDPGLAPTVAQHHGVEPGNILFGAGSSETLTVMGQTFLSPGKKIIGCMPTYMSVYNYATAMGAEGITAPLNADGTQNIDAMIKLAKRHYRDVGFFYLVNPNNPTGVMVPKEEVARVVNEVPEDMMILIDEAYHHFVADDPRYETAMKYVKEGRNVVVARTFSKIYGLAGMRLGYGVARTDIIDRMRRVTTGTQNIGALVKYGAVAALKDPQEEVRVRNLINAQRKTTIAAIEATGYKVLPSNANFYMVAIKRPVTEVIPMFRDKGVLVGRAFPPMNDYMRVSVGTPEENTKFVNAFKQIFTGTTQTSRGG